VAIFFSGHHCSIGDRFALPVVVNTRTNYLENNLSYKILAYLFAIGLCMSGVLLVYTVILWRISIPVVTFNLESTIKLIQSTIGFTFVILSIYFVTKIKRSK
jgi:hypothetical protein